MTCRGCSGSNYSRVKKNKFETTLSIVFPIRAYVCNICGDRFHNKGYYISLFFNVSLAFITINFIYSLTLPNKIIDAVSDTNLVNKSTVANSIKHKADNPSVDYNSGKSLQVQEQNLKVSILESEVNPPSLVAQKIEVKSTNNRIQIDKGIQKVSLTSHDYINKLNTSDSINRLSLKQCFRDKMVILFDQEIFAHYDGDGQEDRIIIEKGQVLVYLSIPDIGITETAHYTYPIPAGYSGMSHYFVFLDRDEDGSIDNKIHAYPKNSNFPTNLCSSTATKSVNSCSIVMNEYPFEVELTNELKAGINWIHSQPNHNYTIQLYASLNPLDVNKFIQENNLVDQAEVFPAIVNGKSYFKVIAGNYDHIKDAQKKISSSSRKNQAFQPLIRKFSTYYAEISELASRIRCP